MEKISLSKRIENYCFKQNGWVHSGTLERLALEAGYKSSNAGRRCREMQNDGILERKLEKGSVLYRYVVKLDNENLHSKEVRCSPKPDNHKTIPQVLALW